jgi:pilus assembly protein CpaB
MKSKSFMLMILSMGFGLIAAIGISQVMGRNDGPVVAGPKMAPVLVAAAALDHKALLNEENVRIENWPIEIIPEAAATNIDQIKDMAIRTRMSKGLPIMMTDLVNKNDVSRLNIPKGYKVVAIKVSEDDTIAGLLNPGDKVDVIGLFKTQSRTGEKRTFSKTFLKALRVFSVNSQMIANTGSRTESSTRGNAIVGVLVTEKQSEAIVYVQKTGTLKLVLRGDTMDEEDNNDEDLLAFGFPDQEQDDIDDKNQDDATSSMSVGYGNSMVIWEGNDPETFTFKSGALPEPSNRSSLSKNNDQEERDDEESSDSFDESDRRLEEDQYRGE